LSTEINSKLVVFGNENPTQKYENPMQKPTQKLKPANPEIESERGMKNLKLEPTLLQHPTQISKIQLKKFREFGTKFLH